MRRILLVPLDGQSLSERGLPLAALLADTLNVDLDLLRVVPIEESAEADWRAAAYPRADRCQGGPPAFRRFNTHHARQRR